MVLLNPFGNRHVHHHLVTINSGGSAANTFFFFGEPEWHDISISKPASKNADKYVPTIEQFGFYMTLPYIFSSVLFLDPFYG